MSRIRSIGVVALIFIIFVSSSSFSLLLRFDSLLVVGSSGVSEISGFDTPFALAYDPANTYLYITNAGSSTVSVLDSKTNVIVATIHVEDMPQAAAYDPSNNEILVANTGNTTVSAINGTTNQVIATISVGSSPDAIGYDPENGYAYVADSDDNNVSVINSTNDVVGTFSVGSDASASISSVLYDGASHSLYFMDYNSGTIYVIDAKTQGMITTIDLGLEASPDAAAIDPNNNFVYVADDDNNLSVIDGSTNTLINKISVGPVDTASLEAVAYSPQDGNVYVADAYDNNVSEINPLNGAIVNTLNVGSNPVGLAYDGENHNIYVANENSNTLTVIPPGLTSTSYHSSSTQVVSSSTSNTNLISTNSTSSKSGANFLSGIQLYEILAVVGAVVIVFFSLFFLRTRRR